MIVLSGFSIYWFVLSHNFETNFKTLKSDLLKNGIELTYKEKNVEGFPFRFLVKLKEPQLKFSEDNMIKFHGDLEMSAAANMFNPRIIARSEDRVEFELDRFNIPTTTFSLKKATFTPSDGPKLSLELEDVHTNFLIWTVAKIRSLDLTFQVADANRYRFEGKVRQVKIPFFEMAVHEIDTQFEVDTFEDNFQQAIYKVDWPKKLMMEISKFEVDMDPYKISSSGSLGWDQDLISTFTFKVFGFSDSFIHQFVEAIFKKNARQNLFKFVTDSLKKEKVMDPHWSETYNLVVQDREVLFNGNKIHKY